MIYANAAGRRSQRGVTLVVALIMLVLMTLLAIAAINISTGNLKIIGNAQYQQEATSAAQSGINYVLSKGSYLSDPTTAPAGLVLPINGTNYTVMFAQPCLKSSVAIKVSELSLTNKDDLKCISSGSPVNDQSDCARVTWQVTATVDDPGTKAKVELVEGVTMRMDRVLADAYKSDSTKLCS